MKDLQAKHKEWTEKNFSERAPKTSHRSLDTVSRVASVVGRMAHHALKAHQGIRGSVDYHEASYEYASDALVNYLDFEGHVSFGAPAKHPHLDTQTLVGVIEEVGELAGAHREGRHEDQIDAVGDIVLYLMDFCNKVGIDFEDAVRQTAAKVHARDWNANSVNGEVPE